MKGKSSFAERLTEDSRAVPSNRFRLSRTGLGLAGILLAYSLGYSLLVVSLTRKNLTAHAWWAALESAPMLMVLVLWAVLLFGSLGMILFLQLYLRAFLPSICRSLDKPPTKSIAQTVLVLRGSVEHITCCSIQALNELGARLVDINPGKQLRAAKLSWLRSTGEVIEVGLTQQGDSVSTLIRSYPISTVRLGAGPTCRRHVEAFARRLATRYGQ